jgi:hypothetical protein
LARYFFDSEVPHRTVRDEVGMNLPHEAEAIHEATLLIFHLLEDAEVKGRPCKAMVGIRNETGACIYEMWSSYAGE